MSNALPYVYLMALHKKVTGSCHLVNINYPDGTSKNIIVDCGLFQEGDRKDKKNKEKSNDDQKGKKEKKNKLFKKKKHHKKHQDDKNETFPFEPCNIDDVLVTHNHVDHIGRLPLLVKKGYNGNIHISKTTNKLIGCALGDSYKVLKTKAKVLGKPPLYSSDDVEETLRRMRGHDYNKSFFLDEEKNIKITFFMNGHLPGAVMILLQIKFHDYTEEEYEDINILFTGDYNNTNTFFDPKPIPDWVYNLPITIIQESTYGDMNSDQVEYVFKDNFFKALSEGKDIILPVFSLGRSQEILFLLKNWQQHGILDKSIPIYFDGKLGMKYTNQFIKDGLDNKPECRDILPENFDDISGNTEKRHIIVNNGVQKIILCTGGMGSNGPAQTYITEFLPRKRALIHFTGFCAEGTFGRKLYNTQYGQIVSLGPDGMDDSGNTIPTGLMIKKMADVLYTSEFSAHARADVMIDFLKKFNQLKLVIVNHGEPKVQVKFAERIINEVEPKAVGIAGTYLYKVNCYGLAKTFTTKFS